MGKIIQYQQLRVNQYPFHRWENEELVDGYYVDNMMNEFKKHINSLKAEDIMDITEEDGLRKYSIVVRFITGRNDDEE